MRRPLKIAERRLATYDELDVATEAFDAQIGRFFNPSPLEARRRIRLGHVPSTIKPCRDGAGRLHIEVLDRDIDDSTARPGISCSDFHRGIVARAAKLSRRKRNNLQEW